MKAFGRTTRAATASARRFALVLAMAFACATVPAFDGRAQTTGTVNVTPSRDTLEQAARDACDNTSVVVQRCLEQQGTAPGASPSRAPTDALDKSRERAKAAFDRRARDQRQRAQDGESDAAPSASGDAQRLAPVTVTGTATAVPAQPEDVVEKALNPSDPATRVLANGNTVTDDADGNRVECQSHCVGPMCCKQLRARPNPAQLSNSIGR